MKKTALECFSLKQIFFNKTLANIKIMTTFAA